MREGSELLRAVREFEPENRARSWWSVVSSHALLAGALAGTLWGGPLWVRAGFSLLASLLVVRAFVIYHDHQHRAILSRSRLADVLMSVFGILCLAPSSVWRSSHNYHHSHNSKLRSAHIGSFPIMTRSRFLASPRGEQLRYLASRHPLTIAGGYLTVFLLGMCLLPAWRDPRRHWDAAVALVVHGLIAAGLFAAGGLSAVLLTLVIPLTIACALGSYLFYAQHNFPGVVHYDRDGWTFEGAALESSSHMRMNPVLRWFTGNIGVHHVHHLDSRIPFYRLMEAMNSIPELQAARTTSLAPTEVLRCLRLKVWDTERRAMVPLADR